MNLEQLHLAYQINEDRILLRMAFAAMTKNDDSKNGNTADAPGDIQTKQEIRVFITRRLLKSLWPVMMQALTTQVTLDRPEAAFASQDLASMQYQQDINMIAESGNFNIPYDDQQKAMPLGEAPGLVKELHFHLNAHRPLHIQISLFDGNQIDMHVPSSILHGLCKLLQDAAREADWDLQLLLPGLESSQSHPGFLN